MYQLDVITLFPEMVSTVFKHGVIGRAIKDKLLKYRAWNPRNFSNYKHKTVDDRSYGGGPGMVMMYEPLSSAIEKAKKAQPASKVRELSERSGMILLSGRYEGIDERLISSEVDEEWSIGDYVLSGGELAAMVLIDTVCRTLPGVLGNKDSANEDSFVDGLLDYPHYTRPEEINGQLVPDILLSGDHDKIRRWRLKQALGKTWQVRSDLIETIELNEEQKGLLQEFITEFEQTNS